MRGSLLFSDTAALLLATQLASLLRFGKLFHIRSPNLPIWFNFADLSLVMVGVWILALAAEQLYDLRRISWGTGEFRRVVRAVTTGVLAVIIIEYSLQVTRISRGWTALAWVLACTLVITGRALVRIVLAAARRRGRLMRPTLVVGCNAEAAGLVRALSKNPASGLVPIGCLTSSRFDAPDLHAGVWGDVPCLGYAGEIRSVLSQRFVDTVLIASTAFDHDVIARIIIDLRDLDVDIQLSSGLFDVTTSRVMISEASGIPLITIASVSFAPWKRFVKRAFDLVVGGLIVLVGMPLWVLLALGIVLGSRGPVFYKQARVGRGGKPFGMYKFRSMVDDADARLAQLAENNEATGPLFKMKDDPRVTRIGKRMRKYSVDEFPQLINVLKGEMSLVGPRPPLIGETEQYSDHHWRRMEVLPGMTGLWQVSGRSRLTFDEMIRLDLFYIENWSVGFDVGLLLRTIPAVVFARGAY